MDKSMLLNREGDWGLGLVSKAAGLEASPSNHPRPQLALHRKPSHGYELGGTCLHLLPAAVSPPSRPTYLITIKITAAARDGALLFTHSAR